MDCPEMYHTSPTTTSVIVTVLTVSETTRSRPVAFAAPGLMETEKLPSDPATADAETPPKVTVTVEPTVAVPFTQLFVPRCRTQWSEIVVSTTSEPATGVIGSTGPTVPPGGLYMTHLWYDDGVEKFECTPDRPLV